MKLAEDRFCSGCTACFAVCPAQAISMQWDRDGFTHPVVDEGKCTGCGLCNRVCPASNQSDPVMPLKCSASRTKDKALLEQSTSGGVFGELARWTLRNGGVVFGCIMGGDRLVAHHAKAETEVEVAAMRGAKYVQSEVGDTFRECLDALKSGRRVLFTGTPCQIAGLNRYLGHDYDNLLTMEIICHGVSSPAVLGKYLADVKRRQGETPRRIFFRSKADGYSWRHPGLVFEFPNCTKCEPLHGNAYFNAFAYGLATRLSCANCTAKSGASGADLTVGDFWGIGQVPETVKNDDMGMSVVIVYSAKAERLLDEIGSRLETYPLTLEQAVEGNPNYNRPSPSHPKRDIFMSSYKYADMSSLVNRFLGKRGFVPFCRKVSRVLKRICCLGFKTPSAGLRMAACATSGGGAS